MTYKQLAEEIEGLRENLDYAPVRHEAAAAIMARESLLSLLRDSQPISPRTHGFSISGVKVA